MSAQDVRILQGMQQQLATLAAFTDQLLEEHAALAVDHAALAGRVDALAGQLAALSTAATAECATCMARRDGAAARQRRLRQRHTTTAEAVAEPG